MNDRRAAYLAGFNSYVQSRLVRMSTVAGQVIHAKDDPTPADQMAVYLVVTARTRGKTIGTG